LAGDDLTDVFAWREERTVSNSLTLQYDKVVFLLEPNEITRELLLNFPGTGGDVHSGLRTRS